MNVTVTAGELLDRCVWTEAADMLGLNPWAANEGLMDRDETVTLTMGQAEELGLLTAGESTRERPHRIDPVTCGCTDCMTGWSVPLGQARDEDVFAMRAGEIQDATAEEFATVTNEDWSGTKVTIRARWSGREWTREVAGQ